MRLVPKEPKAESPVEFVLHGFPAEEDVIKELEKFYHNCQPGTDRRFLIYNTFEELIFSGSVNRERQVEDLTPRDRESNKTFGEHPRAV